MGRTSKNIKLRIPEKPHKIKGFRSESYRVATTISSQSRYDHFDTAPYLSQHQHLGKRGELMGRTSKNIKLRIPEKPHKIKGFRSESYRVATTISSQPRYDHFDTSPCRIPSAPPVSRRSGSMNRIPDIAGEIKVHIKFFSETDGKERSHETEPRKYGVNVNRKV